MPCLDSAPLWAPLKEIFPLSLSPHVSRAHIGRCRPLCSYGGFAMETSVCSQLRHVLFHRNCTRTRHERGLAHTHGPSQKGARAPFRIRAHCSHWSWRVCRLCADPHSFIWARAHRIGHTSTLCRVLVCQRASDQTNQWAHSFSLFLRELH